MRDVDKLKKKIVARIKTCMSLAISPAKTYAYSQSIKIVQEEFNKFINYQDDEEN